MKTILALLLLAVAVTSSSNPALPIVAKTTKIPLQWNASTTPAVTYKLYHSTNNVTWDKTYTGIVGTTYTVTNVPSGSLNWFSVTAVNLDGIESDPSNVVEKPIEAKPAPATGLMSVPIVVNVESTTNNGASWSSFRSYTNNVIASTHEPERKFRSAVFVGTPAELTPTEIVIPR
jgi:fibronectin type 3 domain-containing protein